MEKNINSPKIVSLTEMKENDKGEIVEVLGGYNAKNRLQSLGVRIGKKITKISEQLFHGPVVFEIDGNQLALGYKIAEKIKIRLI